MVVNLVEHNICIIDSLNQYIVDTNDTKNEGSILCKRIIKVVEYKKQKNTDWSIHVKSVSPYQSQRSMNCGPYICLQTYVMTLKNEQKTLPYSDKQLSLFRRNIVSTLFRNEIVEFDHN